MESDFDNIIPGYIKTGREVAENYQGVYYLTQTWEQTFDTFPLLPLTLPRIPLQSLVSVTLIDQDGTESSMDINDFIVGTRSNRIDFKPGKSWPSIALQKFDSVIIRFTVGYADASMVSESVKNFIKAYVGFRLDHPENEAVPENLFHLLTPNLGVAP